MSGAPPSLAPSAAPTLSVWRHPRAQGAAGRCIGRIDLEVDPRRARRVASRIRAAARREGRPAEVLTSPSRRCRDVGRWLARWGWRHRLEPDLLELDFGDWDGRAWNEVGREAVDAWVADFVDHRPGRGESVRDLLARCDRVLARHDLARVSVVTHGGWCSALAWRLGASMRASALNGGPSAATWPPAPAPGRRLRIT